MPVRLIRDGILTSDRIEQLDAASEVFYRRLMSVVDDYGLYDARPSMLRSSLYPLRVDRVREADISRWIAACEKAGLIALYTVASKPYLRMLDTRWIARSKPKFPLPDENQGETLTKTSDNTCLQVKTNVQLDGGGGEFGDVFGVEEPPTTRVRDPDERFAMVLDWKPSSHLPTLARSAGISPPDPQAFDAALAEFVSFWLSQPDRVRTQHEWDHALVKSLKNDRGRARADDARKARPAPSRHTGIADKNFSAGVDENGRF